MDPQKQRAYLQALGVPLLWPRHKAVTRPPRQPPADGPAAAETAAADSEAVTEEPAHPAPEASGAGKTLAALAEEIGGCTACALHEQRTRTVPGVGDSQADLLDAMLAAIHRGRNEGAYIANVVKCRPPGNRDPQADEVAACEGFLHRQIAAIQPRVILALGRVSAQQLLRSDQPLGRMRGQAHDYNGTPLFVSYHPAYLLRNPPAKAKAWADLKAVRRALRGAAG